MWLDRIKSMHIMFASPVIKMNLAETFCIHFLLDLSNCKLCETGRQMRPFDSSVSTTILSSNIYNNTFDHHYILFEILIAHSSSPLSTSIILTPVARLGSNVVSLVRLISIEDANNRSDSTNSTKDDADAFTSTEASPTA